MNKQTIAEFLNKKYGGTKVTAEETVSELVDMVLEALKKGEKVSIAGLGILRINKRAGRTGRNPKTGEAVKILARNVLKFSVAKSAKEYINK